MEAARGVTEITITTTTQAAITPILVETEDTMMTVMTGSFSYLISLMSIFSSYSVLTILFSKELSYLILSHKMIMPVRKNLSLKFIYYV